MATDVSFSIIGANDYPAVVPTWTGLHTFNAGLTVPLGQIINTPEIRAVDGTGLNLRDDGGNNGIFIEDGGFVGMGSIVNPTEILEIADGASDCGLRVTSGREAYVKISRAALSRKAEVIYMTAASMRFYEGLVDSADDFFIGGTRATPEFYINKALGFVQLGNSGIPRTPATLLELEHLQTLTGALADAYSAALTLDPAYTGAFAVTRHNYIDVNDPGLAGGASITDSAVFRFDAAAGVHSAVDGPTVKATPGGVDAWIKVNMAGVIMYVPAYVSKVA